MKKCMLIITMSSMMMFSGCANTTGTSNLSNDLQTKTQEKMVEKTMNNYGIPTLKKEKTTEEKLVDVATGKTSATDLATDVATDKLAEMALKQTL